MVSIKSSCTVTPADPTPNDKLWLPECDQVKPTSHVPLIYFYNPVLKASVLSPFEAMKRSLSHVLVQYYPLAGRLRSIAGGRFELHCNAMGVEIFEAESEATMEDLGDFRSTPELKKFVPHVDYSKEISELPLLLVQVTRFKCSGFTVGVAISHIAVDGQGSTGFFNYWAKITRGEEAINNVEPFHDRTIFYRGDPLAKPRFDHLEFKALPTLIREDSVDERKKETCVVMLKLTKAQVEKLNQEANEGTPDNDLSRRYSRYEIITAHIWRCASKARRLHPEQLTCQRVPVDCRKFLNPPLPSGYYGNAIMVTIATAKSGELTSNPLGLSYGCRKLREAIEIATEDYIKSAIDFLASQQDLTPLRTGFHILGTTQGIVQGSPNLTVTSWIGLPMYEADFGWGRPVLMGPAGLGFDGKSYMIPGDGNGCFTIPIRLQVAHMEDFETFFYGDIKEIEGSTRLNVNISKL